MGEGREGDWECSGCKNRNYAFRSFCNRCKQPRLLVDTKTPADSKWLPRIGDWICTGCTNNNYASREKCKKCGQPKELAAMPAIAMPGVLPTHSHYFVRAPGEKMNFGLLGSSVLSQTFPSSSSWSGGIADKYGVQPTSWPLAGSHSSGPPYDNPKNQPLSVPKGWRSGDWICHCGFHNYSSREQCKNCDASMPPAHGTKRLASEELIQEWDSKRLNLGNLESYLGYEQMVGATSEPKTSFYTPYGPYPSASRSGVAPNWQAPMQFPFQATAPTLLGKGAKQWRNGDWMCTNCNNHNYASRSQCNRCKTHKEVVTEPVAAQPVDAV
ncbi:nuclear pore complex protein Nup153 isoform X2 [Tripterygium wilfordii]|uniref:nuclear pore complex protein Nup153 isoform X2 n=1 Tax=Tripterygium wilfordii TaxID=458696 RepID=UPI0018F7FD25|nr:nuclear pore complex protein Nup153 isoform X2 [Tripterygium wilfordii]